MNKHKNGTPCIGEPGSYQYILSEYDDALKRINDLYKTREIRARLIIAGGKIGLKMDRIVEDMNTLIYKCLSEMDRQKCAQ